MKRTPYYRDVFLEMINYYCEEELINDTENDDLEGICQKERLP